LSSYRRIGRAVASHLDRATATGSRLWRLARWPLLLPILLGVLWGVGWSLAALAGAGDVVLLIFALLMWAAAVYVFVEGLSAVVRHLWSGQPLSGQGEDLSGAVEESGTERVVGEVAWLCLMWAYGLVVFSLAAFLLEEIGAARFGPPASGSVGYVALSEIFLWHALDLVPLAGVPDTMKWAEPAPGRNVVAGLLIVGYKLVVIAPLVAAVVGLVAPRRPVSVATGPR
jgi:hypothetical protein